MALGDDIIIILILVVLIGGLIGLSIWLMWPELKGFWEGIKNGLKLGGEITTDASEGLQKGYDNTKSALQVIADIQDYVSPVSYESSLHVPEIVYTIKNGVTSAIDKLKSIF
jgi:hypothetical protein